MLPSLQSLQEYGSQSIGTEAKRMAMTADQNSRGRYGIGQRFTRLLVRRPALFHFVVAIVVARIAFSVLDLVESRIVGYSLLITLALAIEVVVIWGRIGPHRGGVHQPRASAEGSSLERFLPSPSGMGQQWSMPSPQQRWSSSWSWLSEGGRGPHCST
jgi:hypothetical protein